MDVNADFSVRALVHGAEVPWVPSPMPGVERRMLDRVGDEVARATTIVRYAPGSRFSAHTHGGGEEFLVLEGVFQDEHGDYGPGSYVRNPPTSAHTPRSEAGCTILVKLWQFEPQDRHALRVDSAEVPPVAAGPGVDELPLHRDARERVRIERWAPGAAVERRPVEGSELFVLRGSLREQGDELRPWSWLRLPPGAALSAEAGPDGAEIWVKEGHLRA